MDGKLAAFLFCLVSDKLLIDYFLGFDYTIAHQHRLYFVRFNDVMNWCFQHKIKKYEMGQTSYEPKRRLGFDFVPLYIYAKMRVRLLRPAFKILCMFLKFENFDPEIRSWHKTRKLNK